MDATFPVAKRVPVFEIKGALYRKVRQVDGMKDSDAIRALNGSTVSFFVPLKEEAAEEK